jgi:hypothetical protein
MASTLAPAHTLSGRLFSGKEVAVPSCLAAVVVPVARAEQSVIDDLGVGFVSSHEEDSRHVERDTGLVSRRVRLPTPHDSLL